MQAVAAAAAALLTLGLLRPGAGDECAGLADGAAPLPGTGCRRFAVCLAGRAAARRLCAAGTLFDGRTCVPAALHACSERAPPAGACAGLPDGFHGDPAGAADCRDYLYCAGGGVAVRARCEEGLAWNGTACADALAWTCVAPPRAWSGCRALAPGLHPDRAPASRCRRYFQCAAGNRTLLACPTGRIFHGEKKACVPEEEAESACAPPGDGDTCDGASDGYRAEPGSGCRSYSYCAAGHKITYVCPAGHAFDGQTCAPAARVRCAHAAADCAGRPDGYHADAAAGCRRYFFCLAGARVIAFACPAGKVFDGRRCAEGARCAPPPPPSAGPDPGLAQLLPMAAQLAAPQAPSADAADAGPPDPGGGGGGATPPASAVDAPAADCADAANGFYQDLAAGCRRYFFCIEGRKTSLVCPPDQIFDGQLCVDARTYVCPTRAAMVTRD